MVRSGSQIDALYVILDGVADSVASDGTTSFMLTSGALIGEMTALTGDAARRTYRARSFVTALRIPRDLYADFVERNGLRDSILRVRENRHFLQSTWLFGEMVSFTVANRIAQAMNRKTAGAGDPSLSRENLLPYWREEESPFQLAERTSSPCGPGISGER